MSGETPGDDRPHDVGSVADEAAKLLGAFAAWAHEEAPGDQPGDQPGDPHAPGSPECAWCPVCRGVAWVRGTPPEVRAHLTTAATALAQAGAALLAAAGQPSGQAPGHPGPGRPVEHIDLDPETPDAPQEDAP